MSLAAPMITVGIPFASRWRATRPTVWWHTGQVGTSSATSARVLAARAQELRRVALDRHALAPVGRRAVEARGERAEAAGLHRLAQAREREPRVRVLARACASGRSRRARCADRARESVDVRVHHVELRGGVVRGARPLVAGAGLVRRGGRDQRQPGPGERLRQRRERHLGVVRPAVGRVEAERQVVVARPLHVRDGDVVIGRERHRGSPPLARVSPRTGKCRTTRSRGGTGKASRRGLHR